VSNKDDITQSQATLIHTLYEALKFKEDAHAQAMENRWFLVLKLIALLGGFALIGGVVLGYVQFFYGAN